MTPLPTERKSIEDPAPATHLTLPKFAPFSPIIPKGLTTRQHEYIMNTATDTTTTTLSEKERRAIIEKSFGALGDLHEENLRIMDLIEEAFDPEMVEERKRMKAAA